MGRMRRRLQLFTRQVSARLKVRLENEKRVSNLRDCDWVLDVTVKDDGLVGRCVDSVEVFGICFV